MLATKFGQVRREGQGNAVDGRAAYVQEACEASLKRLGVDMIDLYYQHRVDPNVPVEETSASCRASSSKARFASSASPKRIPIASGAPMRSIRLRPFKPSIRSSTAPRPKRHVRRRARSASALLPIRRSVADFTGAIKDLSDIDGRRAQHPRFQADHFHYNRELVRRIEDIAAQKGCSPSQLTLAWLLAQGEDVVAIPGTRYPNRLGENIGAMGVELTPAEVEQISLAVPKGAASGTRYPAGGMKGVYL